MQIFYFVSKYFWFLAIIGTAINWLRFRNRAQKHIKENPQLAEGYATLLRGYLFWMIMPWVVMGIGCTVGRVPSVWNYFRPRDRNPYVLAWFASVFFLYLLGTFWLFFQGGAEKLAQHPGAVEFRFGWFKRKDITNTAWIKFFWILMLTGTLIALVIMCTSDFSIPNFANSL
jgi:hypothetical protein